MRRPTAISAVLVATAVAAAGGCGSSGSGTTSTRAARSQPQQQTPQQEQQQTPRQEDPLAIPARVPRVATGPADPAAERVIRAWLRELGHNHIRRAAQYFALPSKFQNGTPVLEVTTEMERIAINVALPCGARATRFGGAGQFTIVTFRLFQRSGGDCGGGVGAVARGAIRVRRGQIREWYRLPDQEPPGTAAPTGPSV